MTHPADRIVTLGETMVLLHPLHPAAALSRTRHLGISVAGADSNFAIAMSRLGWRAIWLSAVSSDPLGDLVVEMVGGEGVDVSQVRRDPVHPTGVFFKFRNDERTHVRYYRSGSAASHFQPDWLDSSVFDAAALLHLNGVTCALSESCSASVVRAVALARRSKVSVSLDLNLRLQLWDLNRARNTLTPLLPEVDTLLGTEEELLAFSGCTTLKEALTVTASLGPKLVVAKRGPLGAVALAASETSEHPGFIPPSLVDEVGAGDGFDAGFLSARLRGATVDDALRQGNLVGAATVSVADDVSGYPTTAQLEAWLGAWPARQGLTV